MPATATLALLAVITQLADINRELVRRFEREQCFSVTALVVTVADNPNIYGYESDRERKFHVYDGRRYSVLSQDRTATEFPVAGDRVRFDGRIKRERFGWTNARMEGFEKLGEASLPEPERIDADQLQDPANHLRFVRMEGVLAGVRRDEVDSFNVWLFLRGERGTFLASAGRRILEGGECPSVGDRIELTGCAESVPTGGRRHFQSARLEVGGDFPVREGGGRGAGG